MNMYNKIGKLVYYDILAVTDYVTIMLGGELQLEKSQSKSNVSEENGEVLAGLKGKVKLQSLIKHFLDSSVSMDTNASIQVNKSGLEKATVKYTLKNTVLTNFIDYLHEDKDGNIECLEKCKLKKIKIFEKEDYEGTSNFILLEEDRENEMCKNLFRFNKNNFWNGYFIQDILIMDLDIYAIKVGEKSLQEILHNCSKMKGQEEKRYKIYDVLLAGIGFKINEK